MVQNINLQNQYRNLIRLLWDTIGVSTQQFDRWFLNFKCQIAACSDILKSIPQFDQVFVQGSSSNIESVVLSNISTRSQEIISVIPQEHSNIVCQTVLEGWKVVDWCDLKIPQTEEYVKQLTVTRCAQMFYNPFPGKNPLLSEVLVVENGQKRSEVLPQCRAFVVFTKSRLSGWSLVKSRTTGGIDGTLNVE